MDKGDLLATGSMTLTANVFVDSKRLNMDSSVGVTAEERALALASQVVGHTKHKHLAWMLKCHSIFGYGKHE